MPELNLYDSVAEIYDLWIKADYDVPFFVEEVRRTQGPVLELMAGTGRLSIPLIEAGASLTCVDASRKMLDVLERKLLRSGLAAEIVQMDVRELDLPARFSLALVPFQAFMELVSQADQRAALAAVFRCLAPGGRFICTLHNPPVRRAPVDGVLRGVGKFATDEGSLVVSGIEQGGQPVVTRLQFYEMFRSDGLLAWKRMLAMEFSLIERDAFDGMARDAGFRVAQLFGSYDRTPFDPVRSAHMIWVLSKGAS